MAGWISGFISGSHVSSLPVAYDSVPPSAIPLPLVPAQVPAPPGPIVLPLPIVLPPEPTPPVAQEPPAIAMSAGRTGIHGSTGPFSGDDVEAIVGGQAPQGSLEFRLPDTSAGQSAGNPTLGETRAGKLGG